MQSLAAWEGDGTSGRRVEVLVLLQSNGTSSAGLLEVKAYAA